MKISIITTIYKAENDLPRLLDSMMEQKSQELEFFLIDNGSPDNCGKICRDYAKRDARFKVFTIKDNVGYIRARNIGIQEVDADYIGFCDSDDYLEPGGYDYAITKLKETNCDLYITAYNAVINNKASICKIPFTKGLYSEEQINNVILPQAFGPLPDKPVLHGFAWKQIFRRSIFIENALKYLSELQPYEDQILNIDFISKCISVYIDNRPIYNYVVNPESITAKIVADFDPVQEWKRVKNFYEEKKCRVTSDIQIEALSNQMFEFLYTLCLNAAKNKTYSVAELEKKLKLCSDQSIISKMLAKTSSIFNLKKRIIKYCLINQYYEILLVVMRLGLKLRG